MPGVSGVTVVNTLVCFLLSHTRLRARLAPGIPCALWAKDYARLGADFACENADVRRDVIASDSEAIQRSNPA